MSEQVSDEQSPKPGAAADAGVAGDVASDGDSNASAAQATENDVPSDEPHNFSMTDFGDASPVDTGEFFLGSEATVPQRDYGPPIESHFPDPHTLAQEMRELERRVRARLSPAFPIEYRRKLPLEGMWKRFRQVAMRGRSDMVDDFGRDPLYSARYAPILEFLFRAYFRVRVDGIEHVPSDGRAILVANHSGMIPYDGMLIMHALRREHPDRLESRPLIEDFVFHFPYVGTLLNRIGGVRACPENAERLLEQGQVIIVFPEGMKGISKLYKDRYKLQRFGRGGFIKLALHTGAPVIPVSVVGAEETNPMLGKVTWLSKLTGIPFLPITPTFPALGPLGLTPLPAKWFMRFGQPIHMARDHGPEAAGDRILVNRLADSVRSTIQVMVDDTIARRNSVILG